MAANPDVKFTAGDSTDKDLNQNTICTYNVLEAMRANGCKRIAFGYQDFDNRTMYGMLLLLLLAVMAVNGALSTWEKRLHLRFGQS